MKRSSLVVLTIIISAVLVSIFLFGDKTDVGKDLTSLGNSEIKDGVQYITINAGGGYFPKVSEAKAGVPTKLIVKTKGSFDCSSLLVIHSIGFQKMLPQSGDTEIDIGIPEKDVPLQGVCGMGMYSFSINFI